LWKFCTRNIYGSSKRIRNNEYIRKCFFSRVSINNHRKRKQRILAFIFDHRREKEVLIPTMMMISMNLNLVLFILTMVRLMIDYRILMENF
jgi:hypothetical protein